MPMVALGYVSGTGISYGCPTGPGDVSGTGVGWRFSASPSNVFGTGVHSKKNKVALALKLGNFYHVAKATPTQAKSARDQGKFYSVTQGKNERSQTKAKLYEKTSQQITIKFSYALYNLKTSTKQKQTIYF